MKTSLKGLLTTPWFYCALVGALLILLPGLYLYAHRMDNQKWTSVRVRYEGQMEAVSSTPYAMDFDSSRIVQYVIKPGKGVLALNRLEQGKVTLKGMLGAPGFEAQPLDRSEQPIGAQDVWSYAVMPKRAGDQVLMFRVEFLLADDASPAQVELFQLWANGIAKADAGAHGDLASYVERSTVHVVQPWLRLETIAQVAGLASTIAAVIMLFVRKRDTATAAQ